MKNSIKLLSMLLIGGSTIFSCQDEQIQSKMEFDSSVYDVDSGSQLKRTFGKSLSNALAVDKNMRGFIKSQALKMMNDDYDVPYALVKHERLANGRSFRETLLSYFKNPDDLAAIELKFPLLTIFVPSLPENSFSAEKWNTETEIPYIAIRLATTNDVPMISPEGEEYLLDADLIPSYPVIVIKDNERLISEKQEGFKETKSTRTLTSSDGVNYKFVDNIFDRELELRNSATNQRVIPPAELDQKLIDAYNIYRFTDGWQRDYIYYNISPSSPNGQFTYNFLEHIRSFKIVGDARSAYNKIADQAGDPNIKSGKKSSGWTDGFFEIRANVLIQSQNGIGATVSNAYLVNGAGLFNVTYTVDRRGVWPFRYDYYIINTVTAKPQTTNIPIVNWDLNVYASTLRIDVEESDLTTIVKESTTETVKFATNFGIDVTIKKIGLKFGASLEKTSTNTVERQYTLNSDPLGMVIVNFADNVILSGTTSREYANDIFSISVEPKRVQ